MTCGKCSWSNREGAAFCGGCGAKLAVVCGDCGAELTDGARFCESCGAAVGTVPTPSVAAARKVVTILFADLSGSTALQERLDAEATRRVMSRVHRLLADAVDAEDGHVVKFTGDGLMAVFGIPLLREDDALRAVRAGAAMQVRFAVLGAELRRDLGAEIGLRVGINTGEVVVADDSDDVVGDPVNVAARLEAAAAIGDVLMGSETGRIVRDAMPVESVDPIPLKGKGAPVAAMRLAASAGQPSAAPTAFVGRDDDVDRLVGAFEEAVSAGRARLVTVVGSPGLGKSRLAGEVARSLAARAMVLEARCTPSGGSSFGPVVDALRRAVDLDDAPSEGAAVQAIRARCLPLGEEDASRVAATVAALMAGSPPGSVEQVFWSLRRLFEALSRERPVVLLVDDIQWAEPALLDLVEHIAEWARGGPLLLLALARPELRDLRAAFVEVGGPSSVVIVLGRLDDAAGTQLALDLLTTDALPVDVLSRTLEASEGNPLFLRELLRLLVDDGVLQRIDGKWRATIDAGGIELPPTIHAALAARIEQLRPGERAVLEAASVIGRHFPCGAVLALLPPDVGTDLDVHLESLRRRELVDADGMWRADDRLFRFHHALIRDAAYRRVLKEVRADLHERYAAWLAGSAGVAATDQDEVLGWHLEQAHRFRVDLGERDSDEARALAGRAAAHLGAAARRALDLDDVSTAAALFVRAVPLMSHDDPARPELLRDRCDALIASGDTATAAIAVADLVGAASNEHEAAIADVFDAQVAAQRSPEALQSVLDRAKRASGVCSALGDDAGVAHAELALAEALIALGQVGACEVALDRALAAARRVGDRRRSNAVLAIAPLAALWGPSPVKRASGRCLDLIRVLRITSWAPLVEAHVQQSQAVLEALRDRPEASRKMLESARVTFEDLGHAVGLLQVEMHAGIVEVLADEPAAAAQHLRRARNGFTSLGSHRRAAQATAMLARALLELGEVDEAAELASESDGGDDLKARIGLLAVRSELSARGGDAAGAEALARQAVELAEGTDALLDHADARVALSRALAAAGREDEALREASTASELYERKGSAVGVRRAGASVAARTSTATTAPASLRRAQPNAATTLADKVLATLVSGDVAAARELYVPDAIYIHHETGKELGRDEHLTVLHQLFGGRPFDISRVVFATSGDRLALSRVTVRTAEDGETGDPADRVGPWAPDVVSVAELDGTGRFVRIDSFAPDDLDEALVCFLERLAERTSDPDEARMARAVARVSTSLRLATERRWPAVEALFSPTLEVVDHRVGGTGRLNGLDGWMEFMRLGASTPGGTRFGLGDVLALDARRGLAVVESHDEGRVPGGGAFESRVILTTSVDRDGFGSSIDIFDAAQLDRALARFDELAALVSSTPRGRRLAPNLATAAFDAWADAMHAGDSAALEHLQAPDMHTENHELHASVAREGLRSLNEEFIGADVRHVGEPIATLGPHHAVHRVISTWPDGSPSGPVDYRSICVSVVRSDGVVTQLHRFGDHQLASAMALFVELWANDQLDGGARERALASRAFWRSPAAFGVDGDAFAAYQTENIVVVDHRPSGWGIVHGRAATIELGIALASLADEARGSYTDVLAFGPDAVVVWFDVTGTSDGGASFSRPVVTVSHFGDDGLVDRVEILPPEDVEQALALFDEWTDSPELGAPAPTMALRALTVLADALGRAGDVASLITPDYVLVDRRPLLEHRLEGSDALASQAFIVEGVCKCQPVATRGEHLGLVLAEFVTQHTSVPALAVGEVDGKGLVRRLVVFDPEDEDAAFAELDSRAIASGIPEATNLAVISGLMAAMNRRDLAAIRAGFIADAVLIDHRPARFGEATLDDFLERAASLYDLVPAARFRVVELAAATPAACVYLMRASGQTADGGAFELEDWSVVGVRDGRFARLEQFPIDARADAQACFERLIAADRRPVPNAAFRHAERWYAAVSDGDVEAVTALSGPDMVLEDRRAVVGADARGAVYGELAQFLAAQRELVATAEPIATRGERLAMMRQTFTGPGYTIETLGLHEVDDIGERSVRCVFFDLDDEDAAWDELDARALALAGPERPHLESLFGAVAAFNSRTIEPDLFDAHATVVDHFSGGWGTLTAAEYFDAVRAMYAVSDRFAMRTIQVPRVTPSAILYRSRLSGETGGGGAFEIEHWVVGRSEGGVVTRLERFSIEQRAEAEACFDTSLARERHPAETRAARFADRWVAALAARDSDLISSMCAPGMSAENRRPMLRHTVAVNAEISSLGSVDDDSDFTVRFDPLATRGELLVLVRLEYLHPLWAKELLAVYEVTPDGAQMCRAVSFDVDDEDTAWDELDARALALAGDAAVPVNAAVTAIAHLNARRLEALALDPLATLIDHRPGGWGTLTSSRYVEFVRTMYGLAEQFQVRLLEIPRANSRAVLSRIRVTGVQAGGAFELEDWTVIEAEQGTIGHLEQFPLDRRAEAEACFESFRPA